MQNDWYRYTKNQLEYKFDTDLDNGLSREKYRESQKKWGRNTVFDKSEKNVRRAGEFIVPSALTVLLLLLLIIDGAVSGKWDLFSVIMPCLALLFVFLAFSFAKSVIRDKESYSVPDATVLRGGKAVRVSAASLVPGDIVAISEGDVVPCDGRLIYCDGLRVLEKRISGGDGDKDADFVFLKPGLECSKQKNMAFAKSVVASGKGVMIACDTGKTTLVMRRRSVQVEKKDDLFTLGIMKKASTMFTVALTVILLAMTLISVIVGGTSGLFDRFILCLAACGCGLTELLAAICYIALGAGIYSDERHPKDQNRAAVIKNISKIEKIANLSVIAVPKHYGFCEYGLVVEKFFVQNRSYPADKEHKERFERLLNIARASYGVEKVAVQEREAVFACAERLGVTGEEYIQTEHIPMGGDRLFETSLTMHKGEYFICLSGGARQLLARCASYYQNGNRYPITDQMRQDILREAENYEKDAYRTLAVAGKASRYNNLSKREYSSSELCFEGLIAMGEHCTPDGRETVDALKKMKIRTVMFAEDMSDQNLYLAEKLGITGDGVGDISSAELSQNNLNITKLKMGSYGLFRGFEINHKKFVVNSLTALGERVGVIGAELSDVALTGDEGVSFAVCPALALEGKNSPEKDHGGSEALKIVSDVVIPPADTRGGGGIASAYRAVLNSRMILANIRKILSYISASLTCRVILAGAALLLNRELITVPQLVLSGTLIDLLMIFSLALTGNEREVRGGYTAVMKGRRDYISCMLKGVFKGLVLAAGVLLPVLIASLLGREVSSAECFVALGFVQMLTALSEAFGRTAAKKGVRISLMLPISLLLFIEYVLLSYMFPGFYSSYLTGSMTGFPVAAAVTVLLTAVCFAVLRFLPKKGQRC